MTEALEAYMIGLEQPLDPESPADILSAAESLLAKTVTQAEKIVTLSGEARTNQDTIAEQQLTIEQLQAQVESSANPFAGKTEEEISAMIDEQAKADFRGIIEALADPAKSAGEKQQIRTNANARFAAKA